MRVKRSAFFWQEFAYIRPYHPFWRFGEKNPLFDRNDGLILDLKQGNSDAITAAAKDFLRALDEWKLPVTAILAIVPGHKARSLNVKEPMAKVVHELLKLRPGRYAAHVDTLIRHRTVQKLAHGGDRDVNIHRTSIKVSNPGAVRNRILVVVDDVATTGNSFEACRELLLDSGVRRVGALALGGTTP